MALPGVRRRVTNPLVGVRALRAAEYGIGGLARAVAGAVAVAALVGCASKKPVAAGPAPDVAVASLPTRSAVGSQAVRQGDEIMVAGQLFHTGAPVVLWSDPGGYDAYRVERRFAPWAEASWEATFKTGRGPTTPNRYGVREQGLTKEEFERVRAGGWDLATLQKVVDQFVIHYDVSGVSRNCFQTLHDSRGLSVHFMLDVDGTIYQTLDVKEKAWHATISNDRSVGIEIANIGAYPTRDAAPLARWYTSDAEGKPRRLKLPAGAVRTPGFVGYPSRDEPVKGTVQGRELWMYDLTREQYESLVKLTAALCTALPGITCDYPRDAEGKLITTTLNESQLKAYRGVLGHFHVQQNKIDPGPAFQWDLVIDGARSTMAPSTGSVTPVRPPFQTSPKTQ